MQGPQSGSARAYCTRPASDFHSPASSARVDRCLQKWQAVMEPPGSVLRELERARETLYTGRLADARQILDALNDSVESEEERLLLRIGRLQLELRANPKMADAATLTEAMQALDQAAAYPAQPQMEALALSNLSIVQLRLRLYHASLSRLERAHLLAEKAGDSTLSGRLLANR
eukprot:gene5033-6422_t